MTIILLKKLEDLKLKSSDPNIWENNDAKNIFQDIKSIENKISDFNKLSKLLMKMKKFINLFKKIMINHY